MSNDNSGNNKLIILLLMKSERTGIEPTTLRQGNYETTLLTTRPTEQHNKNLNFGRLNILEKVNKINK